MDFVNRVVTLIERIPRGRVTTYGAIAAAAGSPRAAITVGTILHKHGDRLSLPWQRVVSSRGAISTTCLEHPQDLQAKLLQADGVRVEGAGGMFSVNLKRYFWKP